MATLEKRGSRFRIVFRLNGQKYSRSINTADVTEAHGTVARLADNLRRLRLGFLQMPVDADVVTYLLSDGKITSQPLAPKVRSLRQLFASFFSSFVEGAIEDSTMSCMKTHSGHICRILGNHFSFADTQQSDLCNYVEKRIQEKGQHSKKVSAVTVRKELSTFRTAWNFAKDQGIIQRSFPNRGLRLPKTEEKLPFRTFEEVERRIAKGGMNSRQIAELWDAVFLTLPDIVEVLSHVKTTSADPIVFPMFAYAAYTGARRSEIIRSQLDDLDFDTCTTLIREKKRTPGQITTRRIPLSPALFDALREWLNRHPGGMGTFCVPQSKRGHEEPIAVSPLTPRQMHKTFRAALAGTRWQHLRGWHVFRHSFCSNCAARGVDQRIIDAWVGHQTPEMVKRYRHLIPNIEQAAIRRVFSTTPQTAKSNLLNLPNRKSLSKRVGTRLTIFSENVEVSKRIK